MEPVRVLVAEDDPDQREALVKALSRCGDLRVVGAAENGVEAIRLVRDRLPNVVVCDMVMPQLDGFAVLEAVSRMEERYRPKVIALTALSRDDFITRAMELGVAYYMLKPVDMAVLLQQIMRLAGREEFHPAQPPEEMAECAVAEMLLDMGVPVHLSGYRFLLRSAMLVLAEPEYLSCITHMLYPAVARFFDSTASRVERSIRHAINMAWQRGGADAFTHVTKRRFLSDSDKPTNCELIALICERVRLQGWVVDQSNMGS